MIVAAGNGRSLWCTELQEAIPTLDAAVERSQLLQVLNEVPLNEVPLNEVHEVPVKVGRLRLRQIAYQTGSG